MSYRRRSTDDTTARTTRTQISQWVAANWFSILVAAGFVINAGAWVRLQEQANTLVAIRLTTLQDQMGRHTEENERTYVRKDVIAPELAAIHDALTQLRALIEQGRGPAIRGR